MLKKLFIFFTAGVLLLAVSCKSKTKEGDDDTAAKEQTITTNSSEEKSSSQPANAPKTYQVNFSPDSLYLGKNKEAYIKILSGEAVELQDADGKAAGSTVKIKMRCSNKSTLDSKKYFSISPIDARVELDNGTNITYKNGSSISPEPESSVEADWEFEAPAGAKPVKLNLFYDGTRVATTLTLK
jgi:hypothetical protein